jgi:ABC-2 type transport system permease protein
MIGIWLLLAFIIPASIQQWVSIQKPADLMTEFIDIKRDGLYEIYDESDSVFVRKITKLYPHLKQTKTNNPISINNNQKQSYTSALSNQELKAYGKVIQQQNDEKNELVRRSYWYNPVTYFQNKLNHLSSTHYNDYQKYRDDIQRLVDKRNEIMVFDLWNDVKVDKEKYLEYNKTFNK